MGECFIMRRGGDVLRLPVPNNTYPEDLLLTVNDGQPESATFNVVVDDPGTPAFCSYQWHVDGIAIEGAVGASFTMDNITDSAIHNVYCVISNRAGSVATRSATLTVSRYDVPVLDTAYPADISCDLGGTVTFEAKIIKHGTSTDYSYQWYMDDVAVNGATSLSFKVSKPALGTHRVYCKVTSSAGTVTSRVATLTVDTMILYASGIDTSAVTGGWVYRQLDVGGTVFDCDISKFTANSIDLTGFSKICFEGRISNYSDSESSNGFSVFRYLTNGVLRSEATGKWGNTGNFTIDVSRLSGKYYLGYYVYDKDYGSVNMTKLYLKV